MSVPIRTLTKSLRVLTALVAAALAVATFPCWIPATPALAAPEPEPIPRRWELRIEPGDLRTMLVDVPGIGAQAFYYLTYKVTNTSGEDRQFAPSFELATDRGDIVRSGRGVPLTVTETILRRLQNPFLQDEISVQGLLLQGEENAKEGLVVWPADDYGVNEVLVFAAGFSGETKSIIRPDNGETVVLRKTLMLRHEVLGDLNPAGGRPLTRTQTRWILR